MAVVYIMHPDQEETSKARHILSGRDYQILEFHCADNAAKHLNIKPPDICLLRVEMMTDDEQPFIDVLIDKITDCPVVLLTDKSSIMEHIKLVGEKSILDYFILQPVLDPLRLHLIIEKALSQSALSLNLKDLKTRISDLPGKVPELFEQQTSNLEKQISGCLSSFRNRMKTNEFEDIVKLLDEKALDDKFEQFAKKEISKVIQDTKTSISEVLYNRLTSFTVHLKQQMDTPPDFNNLNELRERLNNPSHYSESVDDAWGEKPVVNKCKHANISEKKILLMDDQANPTDGIAEMLEKSGHIVLTAHSPKKMLDLLRSQEIDVLICGHDLGGVDGIELVRRIKEGLEKAALPVILLTGNATPEVLDQCQQAGISQVVKVPFIPKMLDEKIKVLLNQ